jgi:hypothetical protein
MKWYAQLLDGTPPTVVTYAQISALIQGTPARDRKRLSDGTLIVGMWSFKRKETP